ncbi:MAG: sugar transferase [Faecalimonas sp.]|nr:sugar transferase [Faecalimonas sp.]
MKSQGIYAKYIKRLLDIVCAGAFLLVFWWLYGVLALLVRVNLGSPVIFRQPRPGKDGEIFQMYKFRTMTDERDADGKLLPDEIRLTKFGKFLRSTSLDELPEVWLILTGKLSCVGPRPLLVSYLELYNDFQSRRHEVRPGLTGYAQAYGRNTLTWEEKFEKDVYYVDHISFWLDVKILFKTVFSVLKREGISSETSATMEAFQGTRSEKGSYAQ